MGKKKRPMSDEKVSQNPCITNGKAKIKWNWFCETDLRSEREV